MIRIMARGKQKRRRRGHAAAHEWDEVKEDSQTPCIYSYLELQESVCESALECSRSGNDFLADLQRAAARPLPISIVLNRTWEERSAVNSWINEGWNNGLLKRASPIPWLVPWSKCDDIPGGYDLGVTYMEMKRFHPDLKEWLLRGEAVGACSRQEIVSMIPVAFLDIQPGHMCLDMCASPGSKTTQALCALRSTKRKDGCVIANDVSPKRAYTLTARVRRASGAAATSLVITTHRGQTFPPGIEFDRIICDVPCSGDGTIRKDKNVSKSWTPLLGLTLHPLQIQLGLRSARLLKLGGIMCYSTCSMSPIENEAVVAAILASSRGSLRVVDCSSALSSLPRCRGIKEWRVVDDELNEHEISELKTAKSKRRAIHKVLRRTMWPPRDEDTLVQLERCMRFFPTQHNAGGFFVALLEKVKPFCSEQIRRGSKGRKKQRGSYECAPPHSSWNVEEDVRLALEKFERLHLVACGRGANN